MSGRGGFYDDDSAGSESEAIDRGEVTPVTPEPYTTLAEMEADLARAHRRVSDDFGEMMEQANFSSLVYRRAVATARAGLEDRERLDKAESFFVVGHRIKGDMPDGVAFDLDISYYRHGTFAPRPTLRAVLDAAPTNRGPESSGQRDGDPA